MKITASKSEFLKKLKLVGKIIQPSKINPEYESFLFEIKEDKLHVSGSDESGRITTTIDCIVEDSQIGIFTTDAKTLLSALSEIPEQPLAFIITDKNTFVDIVCEYSSGKFEVTGKKGKEYPGLPFPESDQSTTTINSLDFLYGLKYTNFCCANDELRPVMNGVYFDQNDKGFTYVASDGGTLGMVEFFAEGNERLAFILPSRAAKILTSILPIESEELKLTISSKMAVVEGALFTIYCRLIEGRFPNYRAVIPGINNKSLKVDRNEFISAIKRVIVFCNKNSMLLKLSINKETFVLSAQNLDYSTSADEAIPAEYSGDPIEIGLNGAYLLEILQNIPSDEVELTFSDPSRAVLVKGKETTTQLQDMTFLIMPMMIP